MVANCTPLEYTAAGEKKKAGRVAFHDSAGFNVSEFSFDFRPKGAGVLPAQGNALGTMTPCASLAGPTGQPFFACASRRTIGPLGRYYRSFGVMATQGVALGWENVCPFGAGRLVQSEQNRKSSARSRIATFCRPTSKVPRLRLHERSPAMLSSVLRSPRAVEVNIRAYRALTRATRPGVLKG